MAAVLNTATLDDLDRILPMVAAFHAEEGLATSEEHRIQALRPLLRGSPLGEAFLLGPKLAPIGYLVLSHGYSIEFGGPDAFIDEFFLRPAIRGKGMGGEIMQAVCERLAAIGTRAVHLEVDDTNEGATRLYARRGFVQRSNYRLMTRELR